MSFNTTGIAKIRDELKKGPCFVAQLGALLSPDEKAPGKLRAALEAEGILTRYGRDYSEVYALLPEQEASFDEMMGQRKIVSKPQTAYRFAVQVAFSKNLKAGEMIYITTQPQVRYYVVGKDGNTPENAIPVDEEFRTPGFNLSSEQSRESILEFERKIGKWCEKYCISRETISWTPVKADNKDVKIDISKILHNFIEAQPAEIRDRVNLPGAILQILLSHE